MMMCTNRNIMTPHPVIMIVNVSIVAVVMVRLTEMIISWVITPVIGRIPYHMERIPEKIIDQWSVYINWFENVIRTINVFITHYLYGNFLLVAYININGGNILENILTQHGLNYHKVHLFFIGFNNTKVINIPIVIEIEVRDLTLGIVEHRFKIFQIFCFTE